MDECTCGNWGNERTHVIGLISDTHGLVRADVHMTWSWSDPLPTLALFARTLPLANRVLGRPPARSATLHPAASASPGTLP